jgi:hypothetical protein
VLVEGAGSPAEINLRDRDIANMGFAEEVDCPVILVADIDRGGVFAHLVGTLDLLSPTEQARVKGFVINRFRGDIGLLQSGLDWLEARTGRPVLGVVPYLHGLFLDAEDALADARAEKGEARLRVVAPVYPRISNHTDLDALRLHPQVDFSWVGPGQSMPPADLIVLPGSKAVQADLAWLRQQGWEESIKRHLRYGRQGGRHLRRLPDARPSAPRPAGAGRQTRQRGRPGPARHRDRTRSREATPDRDRQPVPARRRPGERLRDPHGRDPRPRPGAAQPCSSPTGVPTERCPQTDRSSAPTSTASSTTRTPLLPSSPGPVSVMPSAIDLSARRQADLERLADSLEASLDLPRLAACFGPGIAADALLAAAPAKLA